MLISHKNGGAPKPAILNQAWNQADAWYDILPSVPKDGCAHLHIGELRQG